MKVPIGESKSVIAENRGMLWFCCLRVEESIDSSSEENMRKEIEMGKGKREKRKEKKSVRLPKGLEGGLGGAE